MRIHRFYVKTPITDSTYEISDRDLVHQWKKVFRYNVGSQVIVFDGSGTDHLCMISSLRNLGATLVVIRKTRTVSTVHRSVWMCVSLIKKDNFEMVVQKVTELGVTHIVPILAERSEKKKINMERLEKISIEASEQSGRGDVPQIMPLTTLSDLFARGVLPQEKIVLHPDGMDFRLHISNGNPSTLAVFIGSEGGWSDKEIQMFQSYNIPVLSLGSQILRAETSAIAVASALLI